MAGKAIFLYLKAVRGIEENQGYELATVLTPKGISEQARGSFPHSAMIAYQSHRLWRLLPKGRKNSRLRATSRFYDPLSVAKVRRIFETTKLFAIFYHGI